MKEQSLKIVYVPINEIKADPTNPRHMSADMSKALDKSVANYSVVLPAVLRLEDNMLINGHRVVEAALRAGNEKVPAVYVDLSLTKARALGVVLNNVQGDWDLDLLPRRLKELADDPGIDMRMLGFSDDELQSLLKGLAAQAKRDQPETIDLDAAWRAACEKPRAVRGDLFQIGDHWLLCEDSTDAASFQRLLGGAKANMVFTDPPYGCDLGHHGGQQKGQRARPLKNDDLKGDAYAEFCGKFGANIGSNVNGCIYICMSSANLGVLMKTLEELKLHWSDTLIWSKGRFVLGRADYQRSYEPIWYGWPEGTKRRFFGGRGQSDVWEIPRPSDSPLHPTSKPLPLIERALENSTKPGETVLDPFIGGGSTIIAAERTGRICYGIELDERYASVSIARWESFTGKKAKKVDR